MSSQLGYNIKVQIFGQSHSKEIGVVIDGLPAGFEIDLDEINEFLDRRKGGKNSYSTKRTETDLPKILSGLVDGKTCGAPLTATFENNDTKSKDYSQFERLPRPSHADYNASIKHKKSNDIRGGGHFSGRLTLPMCFAGAVCKQILRTKDIYIGSHILSINDIIDDKFNPVSISKEQLSYDGFPALNESIGEQMQEYMTQIASEGDSIGGVVETAIIGLPIGLGNPNWQGIENRIASAIFGIPAVRGIEFGLGFEATKMKGSEHNDPYDLIDGKVLPKTNNAGGAVGGITTGQPVLFNVAFKPTPSIVKPQTTWNLETNKLDELQITGRHDPCIVPRAVPVVEAVSAIVALDLMLDNRGEI